MNIAELMRPFDVPRPFDLGGIEIPRTLTVAMLGPHPDDFDAIAQTMRLFHQGGNRIDLAVVTDGASGVDDEFLKGAPARDRGAIRDAEQRASLRFFGLPEEQASFLHLAEDTTGHPVVDDGNVKHIRDFLLRTRPDLVFLPHGNDTNPGHRRTYEMFRMVVEEQRLTLGGFLIRDPKTIHMHLDCYIGYSEESARWKSQILLHHVSQHSRNLRTRHHGFDERILRVNRQIASELGISQPYAEAFQIEWFDGGKLLKL